MRTLKSYIKIYWRKRLARDARIKYYFSKWAETKPKEEKMLTTEDSTGNKEGQTKPTISPDNAYINKLPEKVNFMIGWKCPNCGAGLSPYASRCGCVDKYVITC